MTPRVATVDFHVTSECSQECPYCWGPQGYDRPVDTATALRILERIAHVGARRVVFTGGDPLQRGDIVTLIRHARKLGLEVALSTTGDRLDRAFLRETASCLDLVSLPLDGSTEAVSCRTKEPGHLATVRRVLRRLRDFPHIDVKVCTPVTRHNLADVPNILRLVEAYADTTSARVFYNVFQAFPRAMQDVEWEDLLVSEAEFTELGRELQSDARVRVNMLDHETLDRLYVMIFPDGSLVIPRGRAYRAYGPFLEIDDLEAVLNRSGFDAEKHLRHARGWSREPAAVALAFVAAVNDHDIDRLVSLMTSDHLFVDSGGAVVRGKEQMQRAWEAYLGFFPDYTIDARRVVQSGDVVGLFGHARGTVTRDGVARENASWEIPAAWEAEIREGRVAVWRVFADNGPVRSIMGDDAEAGTEGT